MILLLARIAGIVLIAAVLWEAFETIILPQRTLRQFRLTWFFYLALWNSWRFLGARIRRSRKRDSFLALFGPLAVLVLLAAWALLLILGFSLIDWSVRDQFSAAGMRLTFAECLYYSGASFFTVGAGGISAHTIAARYLTISESGVGFGFLAVTITYLPVLYGAFSRREQNISLLDARAGSPPAALDLLHHYSAGATQEPLEHFLADWERWAADLLETHMSYPLLGFFRSQHHNQSWVGSLVAVLDACSWLLAVADSFPERQAQLTFAMCRHAFVDLSQVFHVAPKPAPRSRLNDEVWRTFVAQLGPSCVGAKNTPDARAKLETLIEAYEPFAVGLASRFQVELPAWMPKRDATRNWATSPWGPVSAPVFELIQSNEENRPC